MKIVHIAPNAPYNDYWGYQENLLPKYQKKMGHEVTLVVTNTMHGNNGIEELECADYVLNDGVRVIRRGRKKYGLLTNLFAHIDMNTCLEELSPDLIFFHGLISVSILDVIHYKKRHPQCLIVQDNHMDYNIGYGNKGIKNIIAKIFYRIINKYSIRYVEKVYGVTPWRKTYAEEYFGISKNKTDVLIMGADDEKIDFMHKKEIRNRIRSEYGILDTEFLIISGGKIDSSKKMLELISACETIANVKLIIFGSTSKDFEPRLNEAISHAKNTLFIGWIPADHVYNLFFAGDLVAFPGQHSVLWEQACASKVPCLFARWPGMDHVNNGGNSEFIDDVSVDGIKTKVEELLYTPRYQHMKQRAESKLTDIYLYSKIAEKSLECMQSEN